jgi:excisionase family DNA binding protein
MNDKILTIKQLANYLKLAKKTIYRLAANKKLTGFKVGGIWRFRKIEVDKWIDHQAQETIDDKGKRQ